MKLKALMTATMTVAMSLALLAQGPPAGGGQGRGRGPQTPPLIMTSTAWEDGGVIPDKYTAAGATQPAPSPTLSWTQVPPGTQSFALIMHDPEPAIPAKSSKAKSTPSFRSRGTTSWRDRRKRRSFGRPRRGSAAAWEHISFCHDRPDEVRTSPFRDAREPAR